MWTAYISFCYAVVDGVHKRSVPDAAVPIEPVNSREGAPMQVQPYLFFNGRREEAADFYRRTIGAEEYRRLRVTRPCTSPCLPRRA